MTSRRRKRPSTSTELRELRAEVTVTGWLTLVYFEQLADQESVLAKAEAIATHVAGRLAQSCDEDPRGEDMALMLRTLRRRLDQLGFRLTRPADDRAALQ